MDPVVSVFGADVLWTLDEIVVNVFVVFVTWPVAHLLAAILPCASPFRE